MTGDQRYEEVLNEKWEGGRPNTMDPYLDRMISKGEEKLRLNMNAEHVITVMNKLGYSLEDALDFYDIKEEDRPKVTKLVKELLEAVPA